MNSRYFYYASSSTTTQRRSRHSTDTVLEFMPKCHRQLRAKDLAKVPKRRLERDSNLPFGRKAPNLLNLQISHLVMIPYYIYHTYIIKIIKYMIYVEIILQTILR